MSAKRPSTPPPELVEALAAYPALEAPRVTPLEGGLLHASYAVKANGREYIAQRVNPVFSPRIHDNIRLVTRHLEAKGIETLRLIETRAGDLFVDLEAGGRWRLLSRLPGVTFELCGSAEQARSASEVIAVFHAALLDLEEPLHPLGFVFHDTPLHLRELRRAIGQHPDHALLGEVKRIAAEVERVVASWDDLGSMPRRVVHGDLKISNVLYEGAEPPECTRARALIDLDTVCRLPLYVELGDAWRSWCNLRGEDAVEAELDMALFRAAVEGYLSSSTVVQSKSELLSLAEGIERVSLELCARFATDVLCESHFGFDCERFATAGEHNLLRALGQLSLSQQARETRAEQLRFVLG
jgi:Ser/Thr protein kinase RdoA (MazF antagonist)